MTDTLEKDNNNLTISINRKFANDATPLVQYLESNRDKGLKCLFKTIDGACHRLNEEVEAAVKKLKEVIKRNGSTMYELPQDQQTSAMASLFKEFEEPALVAALKLTAADVLVAEAKEANKLYLIELGKRGYDDAKKEDPQLVGENTKKVKVTLDKLMYYLDSYLAVTDNAILKTLYNELSGAYEQANATIKARITRKKNNAKEAGNQLVDD